MSLNETTSSDTGYREKNVDHNPLSDLLNFPRQTNNEQVDFTAPPALKKLQDIEAQQILEKYEKTGQETVPVKIFDPWKTDTLAKLGAEEEMMASFYAVPTEKNKAAAPSQIYVEEEEEEEKESATPLVDGLKATIKEIAAKKANGEIVNLFEDRYRDRLISKAASYSNESSQDETTAPPTKEELVSWSKKVWTYFNNLWMGLTGGNKQAEIKTNIEAVENEKPVQPLNQRPVLDEPTRIQKDHVKKLINEATVILARMQDNLKEYEELLNAKPDVAAMTMIRGSSLRQNTLNKEDVIDRTQYHDELMKINKTFMHLLNRVGEELSKNEEHSKKLGWVTTGLTAVALIGAVFLIFASAGTAAPVVAAVQGATAVAGGINGGTTIFKGAIDRQARKQRGEITSISTDRQLTGHKLEVNVSEMEQIISTIHNDVERIIMTLAMILETIRGMAR